ncbi:conserved hypothetical protein [Anaeromyxobacter sp. K]|uniref:hypothetical protein n=1 Tax=Anaeromyxobacter sp. (strain K) TaxID=447217 RepID=UPI00015F9F29|nr:hypothetical protein [Anaeromyxobacter sp. K]ACG74533.1 conserved hypothetical protein [Anaeromyxobacter sp. K]
MPVELEIRDGEPWWMSPDVWTVPGTDPEGPAGAPVIGQPCYLWALVTNKGTSNVSNAAVRFYWANPSVGFDRNTAHFIGASNVNLLPNESAEVLCLAPWIPEHVNGGHECVLAEAFHTTLDPLPPVPDFDVPTDRHVAQRNLNVVQALRGFFAFPFTVYNALRTEGRYQLKVRQGTLRELDPLRRRLRLERPKLEGKLVRTAFVQARCPTEDVLDRRDDGRVEEVSIRGKGGHFTTLVGRVEGGAALLHVAQYRGDTLAGGISVLVMG